MSSINDLIQQYCPDGCEYDTLGNLGNFYGGITGKSKTDFEDGNAKFISYMNVYSNPSVSQIINDTVKIGVNEKQRTLQYCDVCFTGSSETPDECGMSSVVTERPIEPLYLNSFCFFLRFHNPERFNPHYLKHLFRDHNLRYQIGKTANGVTRFNVSKELMKNVEIPVPPLPVQEEIVRILDKFTELEQELEQELELRKKQYEYYRDKMLSLEDYGGEVEEVTLSTIARISRGGNFQKKDFVSNGKPCIHYGQIYTRYGLFSDTSLTSVNEDVWNKSKKAKKGNIVMAVTSENYDDVCKCVVWDGDEDVAISGHTAIIDHDVDAHYLAHYFNTSHFYKQKLKIAHGTKVIEVTPATLNDIVIKIPKDINEQARIAKLLDGFEKLITDISEGLPAEIKMRHQQYEYYRDKMLTFKRLEAV